MSTNLIGRYGIVTFYPSREDNDSLSVSDRMLLGRVRHARHRHLSVVSVPESSETTPRGGQG